MPWDRDDIELSRLYARGSSALDCADLEIRGVAATTLSSDWLHDRSSPQSARQVGNKKWNNKGTIKSLYMPYVYVVKEHSKVNRDNRGTTKDEEEQYAYAL